MFILCGDDSLFLCYMIIVKHIFKFLAIVSISQDNNLSSDCQMQFLHICYLLSSEAFRDASLTSSLTVF